jgi:putative FmdB family regulatory protein
MPTYQYKREDGTIFEVFQSMSDDALTHCPETGQPAKRMITGGSGVVYKGSGWYVTDYKNGPSGKNSASETTPAPAPESKAENKPADTD